MVLVPGGDFEMGTPEPDGYSNERPVHEVTITGFYMGKYEVTQAQYQEVMKTNPSYFQGESNLPAGDEEQANRPVEQVSWYEAVEFCNKLSEAEGREKVYTMIGAGESAEGYPITSATVTPIVAADFTKKGYRLPTETEWEYAARKGGGSPEDFDYTGDDLIDDVAWYTKDIPNGDETGRKTHAVGKKKENTLGLYDMYGNVEEWCWDRFGSNYDYSRASVPDPTGVGLGSSRVCRGGTWGSTAESLRSARREHNLPSNRQEYLGFRLVLPQF